MLVKYLVPSLLLLAHERPLLSRLVPVLARPEVWPRADWERQYARGDWAYLGSVDELAHYSVVVGYYAFFKPGGSVLDVGCGEGILQSRLAPYHCRHYLGIDFAAEAIQRASERGSDTVSFQVADAATFTPESKFDVIVFNEILNIIDEPLAVLRRYETFLAPGGMLIVSMFVTRNAVPIWRGIEAAFTTEDATSVFNRHSHCWHIRVLTRRAALADLDENHS